MNKTLILQWPISLLFFGQEYGVSLIGRFFKATIFCSDAMAISSRVMALQFLKDGLLASFPLDKILNFFYFELPSVDVNWPIVLQLNGVLECVHRALL